MDRIRRNPREFGSLQVVRCVGLDPLWIMVWSGMLPTSNQTIQRAEILAGAVAMAQGNNAADAQAKACVLEGP